MKSLPAATIVSVAFSACCTAFGFQSSNPAPPTAAPAQSGPAGSQNAQAPKPAPDTTYTIRTNVPLVEAQHAFVRRCSALDVLDRVTYFFATPISLLSSVVAPAPVVATMRSATPEPLEIGAKTTVTVQKLFPARIAPQLFISW
jgi:hypothetical protein